jgi:outer membrane lipoprotein SlyB
MVTTKACSVLMIAAIVAAALAGCASESQYSARFFNASGQGNLMSIVQTSAPPSSK